MASTEGAAMVDEIKRIMRETFEPLYLDVEDLSDGCGSKINLVIVSSKFEGVSLIDRQRQVNDALKDLMPNIHALTMKTWTPAQYEKKKDQL